MPYHANYLIIESRIPAPSGHSTGGHDTDPIAVARGSFLNDRPQKESPSKGSRPSSFRDMQTNQKTRMACGRPRDAEDTIPATLLHPVFGEFIDDCHATLTMTESDNTFVGSLADAMSALYVEEKDRVEKVIQVFKRAQIEFDTGNKVTGTSFVIDADIRVPLSDSHHHPYVIAEFKNEAAASGSEPYMQAAAYYLESTRGYAADMSGSALPCFLLILFGQYYISVRYHVEMPTNTAISLRAVPRRCRRRLELTSHRADPFHPSGIPLSFH